MQSASHDRSNGPPLPLPVAPPRQHTPAAIRAGQQPPPSSRGLASSLHVCSNVLLRPSARDADYHGYPAALSMALGRAPPSLPRGNMPPRPSVQGNNRCCCPAASPPRCSPAVIHPCGRPRGASIVTAIPLPCPRWQVALPPPHHLFAATYLCGYPRGPSIVTANPRPCSPLPAACQQRHTLAAVRAGRGVGPPAAVQFPCLRRHCLVHKDIPMDIHVTLSTEATSLSTVPQSAGSAARETQS